MHDLTTIQRMNLEALRRHDDKVRMLALQLDEMLVEWENLGKGDVPHFIWEWAEKLAR